MRSESYTGEMDRFMDSDADASPENVTVSKETTQVFHELLKSNGILLEVRMTSSLLRCQTRFVPSVHDKDWSPSAVTPPNKT